jgi:hypothetical protein
MLIRKIFEPAPAIHIIYTISSSAIATLLVETLSEEDRYEQSSWIPAGGRASGGRDAGWRWILCL